MKVLIISLRYFGDCFLSAALARPIKERFPTARVDLLTYKGIDKIIEGHDDIDQVITIEKKLGATGFLKRFYSRFHDYDWAFITQESTRAVVAGLWLAKRQAKTDSAQSHRSWWKNFLTSDICPPIQGHFLDKQAALLKPLLGQIPAVDPVATYYQRAFEKDIEEFCQKPFVVCHFFSRFEDKNWSENEWRYLLEKIQVKGYGVALTGGNDEERSKLEKFIASFSAPRIINLAGRLSFEESTRLIARSALYVGVDTATSHLAAATGVPTICLFGPTDVCTWGPSPAHNRKNYDKDQPVQINGNVTIVRHPSYLHCNHCHDHICPLNEDNPRQGLCLQKISAHWLWNYIEQREIL